MSFLAQALLIIICLTLMIMAFILAVGLFKSSVMEEFNQLFPNSKVMQLLNNKDFCYLVLMLDFY